MSANGSRKEANYITPGRWGGQVREKIPGEHSFRKSNEHAISKFSGWTI
jgi:hypothetical protein